MTKELFQTYAIVLTTSGISYKEKAEESLIDNYD